jgi:hypothetical protein
LSWLCCVVLLRDFLSCHHLYSLRLSYLLPQDKTNTRQDKHKTTQHNIRQDKSKHDTTQHNTKHHKTRRDETETETPTQYNTGQDNKDKKDTGHNTTQDKTTFYYFILFTSSNKTLPSRFDITSFVTLRHVVTYVP